MKTKFLLIPIAAIFLFTTCKKEYYSKTEITAKFYISAPYNATFGAIGDSSVSFNLYDCSYGDLPQNGVGGIYLIKTIDKNVKAFPKTMTSIPIATNSTLSSDIGVRSMPSNYVEIKLNDMESRYCTIMLYYQIGDYVSNYYQVIFDARKFNTDYQANEKDSIYTDINKYIVFQGDL